jgi:hypothetical protein
MRMDDGPILRRGVVLLAFFGHTFLQGCQERARKERTRIYVHKIPS